MRPYFLQALDHPRETDAGWTADCPICRQQLELTVDDGHWLLACAGGCTEDELTRWLQIDTRVQPQQGDRLWITFLLANTPEQWAQLLRGNPIPAHLLNQAAVERLRRAA